MIIRILGRNVELVFQKNLTELNPEILGHADFYQNKLYFDGNDSMSTILHEIAEYYAFHSGAIQSFPVGKENFCDLFAKIIELLILENGIGILGEIKSFLNEMEN